MQLMQSPPPCNVATASIYELEVELIQIQELECRQQIYEQKRALHTKVGHSSEAKGWATMDVLVPTASLPTVAVHTVAMVSLLEQATSTFLAGIQPALGARGAPREKRLCWSLRRPIPLRTYTRSPLPVVLCQIHIASRCRVC